jgi:hypothetical protein
VTSSLAKSSHCAVAHDAVHQPPPCVPHRTCGRRRARAADVRYGSVLASASTRPPPDSRRAPRETAATDVRDGSFASIWQRAWVRSFPHSGHLARTVHSMRCAKIGHERSQQSAVLFDHLVGAREQRRRHSEAEPPARAQQSAMPAIGILIGGAAESFAPFEPAFRKGLSEGGFLVNSNLSFESRRANGRSPAWPAAAHSPRAAEAPMRRAVPHA